ncbi:MAG: DUF4249 domain-containing protein [Cyclobacteriaceae bacterium]
MRTIGNIIVSLFSIAFFWSCTKPFEAESFTFKKVLVVDGQLTDEDKFHQVALSFTFPIGEEAQDASLSDAEVWVESGDGTRIDYNEIQPGLYESENSFAGESNQSYQLFFTTAEGRNYASVIQNLIPSPEIDSIYDSYTETIDDEFNSIIPGAQFFLDSHDETGQAEYFRYEWKEDYKIKVPLASIWEYDKDLDSVIFRTDPVHICYESSESSEIIIGNSIGSSGNRVAEQPINFVSSFTDKYRTRYAIQAKQYAINESAFGFYRKLKESNESGGSLFDKQQGTIAGNIRSLDDPSETVLGYFEVAGVSDLRAFFDFADLDERLTFPSFRFQCGINSLKDTTRAGITLLFSANDKLRIVSVESIPGFPENDVFSYAVRTCADCSWYAPTEPPQYWID